ncbi:MAG: ATP-binding cassette domain-containing protein [Pseudomonadales bacterium]|nr:ATP-binding cassette domain-containing protein [Pseudomonadales bacterium]
MAVDLTNVRFHYPEQPNQPVLNIPSWSLSGGEQVFIHGPSGGGKSTLLNLLSGLLMPDKGQVSILGQRLDQMKSRQRDRFRANHIGYMFQQFNLISYLNALDNILLASQFSQRKKTPVLHDEIKNLLTVLNISENDWCKPARNLSIGQQQRVAIARALINKPQLLIADEPTSSLDPINKEAFMELLMSVVSENSIALVFVSHDLSLSKNFNRVESLSDINRLEGLA